MPTHIFLSFAKADSDKIQSLKEHFATLVRNQEIILYSPNDYLAGTNTEKKIQEDLAKSHYFLACLSSKYNSNEHCQKEVEMAMQVLNDNAIIPLLLQSCDWEYAPFVGKKPVPKSEKFIYSQKGEYIDAYYVEVVENIKTLLAQTTNKPPQNTEFNTNFNATLLDKNDNNMLIGRRADYERLIVALSPNKPTNIRGIAGIGKTTLVNFYLSQNETKKRFPTVHRIVLADSRQEQKMNRSIAENTDYQMNTLYEVLFLYFLDKIEFGDADHETKLHKIAQYLAINGKNTLLILDNADSYQDIDRNFAFLRKTNCTILITSRNHIQGTTEIGIEKVSLPAAKIMFLAYNPTLYPPEKIENLLKNIDCHTLLIELCAKQLYEGADINIDALITAAAQYDFSVLTASHIALSDDTYIETALDKFILYLFRPDTLTENEQQILRYFSLLRNVEYPLDKLVQWFTDNTPKIITSIKYPTIFHEWFDKFIAIRSKKTNTNVSINIPETLYNLSQRGWLQKNIFIDNNKNIVTYQCHIIVSYAIHKLLISTINNCLSFLENIIKEGNDDNTKHIIHRTQYLLEFLHIANIFTEENKIIASILFNIGNFYYAMSDYQQTLEYYKKAILIREKILGKEHHDTLTIYNSIAVLYHTIGDYPQALEYYQKQVFICKKVLGKEHPDTAKHYNNIGSAYHDMNNYLQALEYYQKALTIFEKILGKEHFDTAITYNNLAWVYEALQEYKKALAYIELAIAIIKKKLPKTHPYKIGFVKTKERIKEKIKKNEKK